MRYTLEIQKLLLQTQNDSLHPREKANLLKEAIRIADENEDVEWATELRLDLIYELNLLSADAEEITVFSKILDDYENHKDVIKEDDLLWKYKWIWACTFDLPEIPMEQVKAIGEDYKTRILRNGYSLRSYYHRWSVECVWMRQYDKAKEYIDKMLNEKIDGQSCEACELNFMLDYYLETGQFDEAYSRAQPLINKQVTCYEANLRAYLKLSYYAQKAGKPEVAADMCARAEEALQGREKDEYLLLYLGLFIAYNIMTKPERGWEYAERCIGWSLRTNTLKKYRFSCDMVEALKYETRRIEDSEELYNITGWGTSYFGINDKGHVVVTPRKDGVSVDLKELVDELQLRDVASPMLVRFPDILDNRIEKMSSCFKQAAEEYGYKAQNFIIYPIKVNQMRPVVEEIISHGKKFNLGLEAGSKPELHAVIAVNTDSDSLIVCNGYKDESYIELALLAQKMGKRIYLVVEKMNELKLIAKMAKQLNVQPNIGIRIKLASSGSGKWEESGGDASKFGLTSSELLEALDFLESKGLKDCLKLIHFHIGSQVTKIRRIKTALREASQFYVQLHSMGFNVEFVDIGGGLGVDYDGTRSSNSEGSVNYSIQEYVNDSISTLVDVSDKNGIPHPNIITESGRALTAHHSVLIFEVLETATLPEWDDEEEIAPDAHELVQELYGIWDSLNQNKMLEAWHDAQQIREEALDLFSHGIVDLKTRAQIERLYWSITREINQIAAGLKSDGKIANFISTRNVAHYLPVHALKKTEPYYVAVFLVGAYQEILGDMHNLFGDTNAVHVSVNEKGYNIEQIIDGETVAEVLDYVQYNPKKLVRTLETWVTKSVKEGKISLEEGKEFLSNYRSGLYGYTYLE